MFFDELTLELEGGKGGNGMVSFHREKFVAHGPPDGGDGGDGGSIILEVDTRTNTFRHFSGRKSFRADPGGGGHKNNCHGKNGEDLVLKVPEGTRVYNQETGDLVVDLLKNGQRFELLKGGRGGYGNAHFVASTRQAPRFAELGDVGEKMTVRLELQLVADVALVGFPSAGKSTMISHLSAAKPKVGDYPFTTLVPNLGVVQLSKFGGGQDQTFVVADMPGLIEGASEGKGLGDRFLKHISRTAVLVYVLDPYPYEERSMVEQYEVLRSEIEVYQASMLDKPFYVLINKIDALPEEDRERLKKDFLKSQASLKGKVFLVSGVSGEGMSEMVFELWNAVQKLRSEVEEPLSDEETEEHATFTVEDFVDDHGFEVERMYGLESADFEPPLLGQLISDESRPKRQLFEVRGKRIQQISRMTNPDQEDAIRRIYDVLQKMGIQNELHASGAENGDVIKIEPHFFEYHQLSK